MKTITTSGATYKTVEVRASGNVWAFTQVTGKYQYVNVRKVTNNPYKGLGNDFPTWDAVESHYNSLPMQMAILTAQEFLNK